MAKETTATGTLNEWPFFSTTALESFKEFWGFQVKVGQAWTEQAVKVGQTWTDYAFNQAQDAAKVSQDCVKQSMAIAEGVRKGWVDFSDKVWKNN